MKTYGLSMPRALGSLLKNAHSAAKDAARALLAFGTAVCFAHMYFPDIVAKDEVSVIITKTPCVLLSKAKKPLYTVHTDKCKKCGMCMRPGCPAMTRNADGTIHIDDTMCTGCGLCESLCKFDAIELVKEGDR